MAAPAVGIDLGTTFSVVAHLDALGRPASVPNADGDLTTPSVVFLDPAGAVVGKEAVKAAEFDPDRGAAFPKRDMGRALFHKPVRGEQLPPEVLQAVILRKLKLDAEQKLGPLTNAVITVPAYFNEPRRKLTEDAGRMAGWNVLAILNEPTAAAIAYGVGRGFLTPERADHAAETILVYDLGGGTFDVTLMSVEQNSFTALATAGDVELGGIDWDARLAGHIADRFNSQFGLDPLEDPVAAAQLRREAEDAKRALSARTEAIVAFSHGGHRLKLTVTRREFEDLTGDLLDRTLMTLRKLMRDAGKSYADLTRLLVVGGSTRMPMVAAMLEAETGRTVDRELSADEAVAHGAALYADLLTRSTGEPAFRVRNVSAHDLGIVGFDRKTKTQRRRVMIPRNTPLPASAEARFPMMKDGQRSVMVNVVEGGDATGKHASAVGKCLVQNLPPGLPKSTAVEVSFAYTEQGRLEVRAALPSVNLQAETVIERAVGVPELQLAAWTEAVRAGLPDAYSHPDSASAFPPGDWDVEPIEE